MMEKTFNVFAGLYEDEVVLFSGNIHQCREYIDGFIETGHSNASNWVILPDGEVLSVSSKDDGLF